jgi:hypothetical protein
MQVITRATPDGASFPGMCPAIKCVPYQKIYKFDMLAPAVKRYSMSVGASAIVDVINFQLSDIPQYATFTSLFDQYRIKSVVVAFKTSATQTYWGNSSGDVPLITTAIDYNDNSSAGVAASDFQTAVTNPFTTSFSRTLSPRTAVPVFNGVTNAYQMGAKDAWLDTTYTGVPHYQLVVNSNTTSIDNQFVYTVDVLYSVEFCNVR